MPVPIRYRQDYHLSQGRQSLEGDTSGLESEGAVLAFRLSKVSKINRGHPFGALFSVLYRNVYKNRFSTRIDREPQWEGLQRGYDILVCQTNKRNVETMQIRNVLPEYLVLPN